MLIKLTNAFVENENVYLDPDCIKGISWVESCEVPHTNIHTTLEYMKICCVKETPDEVADLYRYAAKARKEKDGIK